MEFSKCKSVLDNLNKYDYLAGDSDYIVVTEWNNGEGFDVDINGKQQIHLTNGELAAVCYLAKSIEYNNCENEGK